LDIGRSNAHNNNAKQLRYEAAAQQEAKAAN